MCDVQKDVKLTRSEAREQAFMLLFSRSFLDEPWDETVEAAQQLFEGGVCDYAMVVVPSVEDAQDEIDADISRFLKKGWWPQGSREPRLRFSGLPFTR